MNWLRKLLKRKKNPTPPPSAPSAAEKFELIDLSPPSSLGSLGDTHPYYNTKVKIGWYTVTPNELEDIVEFHYLVKELFATRRFIRLWRYLRNENRRSRE